MKPKKILLAVKYMSVEFIYFLRVRNAHSLMFFRHHSHKRIEEKEVKNNIYNIVVVVPTSRMTSNRNVSVKDILSRPFSDVPI